MTGYFNRTKPPEPDSRESRLKAVFLFGPTGVGKTAAIEALAGELPGMEVISADSVQVYRGLDIGSAKASVEERRRIPHHNIDVRDPDQDYTVADFVAIAREAWADIQRRGGIPVVSGGTAFYLKHLWFGLPESPPADRRVAEELKSQADGGEMDALREELAAVDPESASRIAPADRYRILRALEVYRSSGRPLSSYRLPDAPLPELEVLPIALNRNRDELYRRIDARVRGMFDAGLTDEVRSLLRRGYGPGDPGMKAIGYREFLAPDLMPALDRPGDLSPELRERLIGEISLASRRYAKRQLTFFRALPGVHWADPEKPEDLLTAIRNFYPSVPPAPMT
jgi:tRNA dimethylallyltransferase